MRSEVRLILALCISCLASCRATNNVRSAPGKDAVIPITKTGSGNTVKWELLSLDAAWNTPGVEKTLSGAKRAVLADGVASKTNEGSDENAILPQGDYGGVYLLHVKEKDSSGAVVRNTVTTVDDRDPALGVGSHVGLLFLQELDAMLTSAQVSLYPARLWAIDSAKGWNMARFFDGFSIDAGIASGSVNGDAPAELGGRVATTFGMGYTFAAGWALKGGVMLYRDQTDGDDLTESWYWGVSYDLLSGLVSASKAK